MAKHSWQTIERGQVRYSAEEGGVWFGEVVFLPRGLVIRGFQELAAGEEKSAQEGGLPGSSDSSSSDRK